MASALRLTVDFGTTNSVVAVAEEGSVRVIPLPDLASPQPDATAAGRNGANGEAPLVPTAGVLNTLIRVVNPPWFGLVPLQRLFQPSQHQSSALMSRLMCGFTHA
jgi:hypothetical protein